MEEVEHNEDYVLSSVSSLFPDLQIDELDESNNFNGNNSHDSSNTSHPVVIGGDSDADDFDPSVQPGRLSGEHFNLKVELGLKQQRERIAICPPSGYPCLVAKNKLRTPGIIVVADLIIWDTLKSEIINQTCERSDVWKYRREQESWVKTPKQLSSKLNAKNEYENDTIQFFYRWKFYIEKNKTMTFFDEVTSNLFSTVSHSKLCDNKRRHNPKSTNKRGPKRTKLYTRTSDDDEF